MISPDIFQTVPLRRDPETVALSAATNATGLFELEPPAAETYLPFEGHGLGSIT